MSSRAESRTVYAAGLVQGVVLVTFPAASTIFTEPSQYGLSSTGPHRWIGRTRARPLDRRRTARSGPGR